MVAVEGPLQLQLVQRSGEFGAVGLEVGPGGGELFTESNQVEIPLAGDIGGGGQQGQTQDKHRSDHERLYVRSRDSFRADPFRCGDRLTYVALRVFGNVR